MGKKRRRVELLEEDVTLGSYCLDESVPEYMLSFRYTKNRSLVDEYEPPNNNEPYIVMTSTTPGEDFPNWITITSPDDLRKVIDKDDECLPDLHFIFKGEEISLIDFFKKYIFKML